jgi:hypothetical protein
MKTMILTSDYIISERELFGFPSKLMYACVSKCCAYLCVCVSGEPVANRKAMMDEPKSV